MDFLAKSDHDPREVVRTSGFAARVVGEPMPTPERLPCLSCHDWYDKNCLWCTPVRPTKNGRPKFKSDNVEDCICPSADSQEWLTVQFEIAYDKARRGIVDDSEITLMRYGKKRMIHEGS